MTVLGCFRRMKRIIILDPVYRCVLYKNHGCAHVDGLLCDFPKCFMRKKHKACK